MRTLSWPGIGLRFVFALILVLASYNPTGYSYYDWVRQTLPEVNPYIALAGLLLLVGWVIYLRAAMRSLGLLGMLLVVALCGCILWILSDWGWLDLNDGTLISWLLALVQALVLTIGMCWSHIRRRLSGQVDVDDVDQV